MSLIHLELTHTRLSPSRAAVLFQLGEGDKQESFSVTAGCPQKWQMSRTRSSARVSMLEDIGVHLSLLGSFYMLDVPLLVFCSEPLYLSQ